MGKVLHIDDIIKPSIGYAVSTKPIIESYIARYNQFSAKDIKLYAIRDNDNYIIHVMVPSEKNATFEKPIYYDVIIEFYPEKKENMSDLTIKNYGVKLFSNSINWTFNFTYIFAKSDNIPKWIPKKYYSELAMNEPPKKTNPLGIYGIERVVFIAFYHLELMTGYRKNRLQLIDLYKTKPADIVKKLMSQEEKLAQLNAAEKKVRLEKKKIKDSTKLNIIKKKEIETNALIKTTLDKNFDSNLKTEITKTKKDILKQNTLKNAMKKKW